MNFVTNLAQDSASCGSHQGLCCRKKTDKQIKDCLLIPFSSTLVIPHRHLPSPESAVDLITQTAFCGHCKYNAARYSSLCWNFQSCCLPFQGYPPPHAPTFPTVLKEYVRGALQSPLKLTASLHWFPEVCLPSFLNQKNGSSPEVSSQVF